MEEAKSQSLREASKTGFFVRGLDNEVVSPLFDAVCEATAEAIWNALCAAEDFTGRAGNWAPALPHDDLVALLARHGRIQIPS